MSLLEIAVLRSDGKLNLPLSDFFDDLQANPLFRLLPLTYEIALEVASLGSSLRARPIEQSLQPRVSTGCAC